IGEEAAKFLGIEEVTVQPSSGKPEIKVSIPSHEISFDIVSGKDLSKPDAETGEEKQDSKHDEAKGEPKLPAEATIDTTKPQEATVKL
ncbi:hypothetical protein ABTM77_20600, partial [Acinetobacter baumannii]